MIGGNSRIGIALLNSDGTLNMTFDANSNGRVATMDIQADGKLSVGGLFTMIGGLSRNVVARLDADTGIADPTFDAVNGNSTVLKVLYLPDTGS